MCGARLHAKYLQPVSDEPVPLVLQFHGYPGASRSWFEQASFAGMGMALIALDCPGQGGPPRILVDLKARRLLGISSPVSTATRPILLCPLAPGYPHSVPYCSRARGHRSFPRICERRIAGRRFGHCDLRA
ncbi:MAG: acetylxylan esterase [Collinsella sp.]